MAKVSKVEAELLKATGLKQGKADRNDFLKKVHKGVGDLDEDDWKALSDEAQAWYNDNTKKVLDWNRDHPDRDPKALIEFLGFDEAAEAEPEEAEPADAEEAEEETETEEEEAELADDDKKSKKKPAAKKAEKPAAKKPEAKAEKAKDKPAPKKPAKEEAERAPRGSGVVDAILAHVHKNPKDKPEEIVAALKEADITASKGTAASVRSAYRQVCRFLQKKKLLTKDLV